MWLPKEERKLLCYYYRTMEYSDDGRFTPLRGCTEEFADEVTDFLKPLPLLRKLLRKLPLIKRVVESQQCSPKWKTVLLAANWRLLDRQLLVPESGSSIPGGISRLFDLPHLRLTIKGWDLGRKYSCPFRRFGLWFCEYKDQGAGLVFGVLGGVLGSLILNKLT